MNEEVLKVSSTVTGASSRRDSADVRQALAAAWQTTAEQRQSAAPGDRETAAEQRMGQKVDRAELDQAIEELRERVQSIRRTSIDFSIDETTSRTVIKVIDVEKDEVILQMPSERLLELAKFFAGDKTPDKDRARRSGLLIDERA